MKKAALALLVTVALAACNVTVVVPGPAPGTPVAIGDANGVQVTLDPGAKKRFELVVAGTPVRIDVFHQEATAEGELYLEVFDQDDDLYAHTNNRAFFAKAGAALATLGGVGAQDIGLSFPYSVNLPVNMGKVYLEVENKTAASATVTVKAFERNEVVRENTPVTNPDTGSGETSKGYGGAILFLGQRDTYVYQGANNYQLTFGVPGDDPLGLRLRIVNTNDEIGPGQSIVLLQGDTIEVFSTGDARAGFCNTFSGCADGIDTGEYTLTITP